jgi:hypothetical protein
MIGFRVMLIQNLSAQQFHLFFYCKTETHTVYMDRYSTYKGSERQGVGNPAYLAKRKVTTCLNPLTYMPELDRQKLSILLHLAYRQIGRI